MASLIGIARLGKEAAGAAAQQLALPFAQHAEALALQTSGETSFVESKHLPPLC